MLTIGHVQTPLRAGGAPAPVIAIRSTSLRQAHDSQGSTNNCHLLGYTVTKLRARSKNSPTAGTLACGIIW